MHTPAGGQPGRRSGRRGAGRRQPDHPRDPEAPPFLLVHGTADWLVPYAQSEQLHAALTAAGSGRRLVPVEGAEHIFDGCDDIDAVVRLSVDYLAEAPAMSDLTVPPITVEHHREPFGIGEPAPRLSWVTRTDLPDWRQAAYELEIEPEDGEVWSSGRIDSAESVLVPWERAGATAAASARTVRVRVWGESATEPSAWSEDVVVEAGLLEPADWSAQLVQPVLPDREHEEPAPCCGGSSCSTSRSSAPGCTPPRRASTRRS